MLLLLVLPMMESVPSMISKNDTIQVLTRHDSTLGPPVSSLVIVDFKEQLTHDTLNLQLHQQYISLVVIGSNLAVGLLYRVLLVKNVHENGQLSRPINLLTVVDEAIKFVGGSCWHLVVGISIRYVSDTQTEKKSKVCCPTKNCFFLFSQSQ